MRHAYGEGFYESPHSTSIRKPAKELNCSPSTPVRDLRRAEKKVIAEKFE